LGLDVNEGFVVEVSGESEGEGAPILHHGKDAIQALALLSDRSLFGGFNRLVFSNVALNRALYPVLKFCRNSALRVLGRKGIEQPQL